MKLACRHVHRNTEARGAARVPRDELLAGAAEDPLADAGDEADVLGERDELARRQDPFLRVLPANERLRADRLTGREAEDRLVVEDELAAGQRAPESALHRRAFLRLLLHPLCEELKAVAARLLRAIHRGVDVRDEHLGVLAVAREETDADGRLDEELPFLDQERLRDHLQDLPRHRRRVGLAPDPVHEQKELVPAYARHGVVRADAAPKAVGRLHEKLVACRVAERVVDALEVVEVEEHDRKRLAPPLCVKDREGEPVVE